MIHIKRRFFFIPINEFYFCDDVGKITKNNFLNIFIQSNSKIGNFRSKKIKTSLIDLTQGDDIILKNIGKNTRYEINRALKKDSINFVWDIEPDEHVISSFCDFYNDFAQGVGLKNANKKKLELFSQSNALAITKVVSSDNQTLCQHALIYDDHRIRLLYSVSKFRELDSNSKGMVGRANRALHWHELLQSKILGKKLYDFGGISINGETKNIDRFKLSFGGNTIFEFNSIQFFK